MTLVIENHQDFTSRELVAFCDEAGENVGIVFDTGNTFPVAEAPLDFTRVIAAKVLHVHLKDYRVQFTDEGYRLVRCAIGDGAVPFSRDAVRSSRSTHIALPAVLEPGRARSPPRAPFHARLVEGLCAETRRGVCRMPECRVAKPSRREAKTTARRGSAGMMPRSKPTRWR